MPINNQLYKSIVPINNDATRTYSRERIERINADKLYVTIGGKKVLKSSLNLNKDTLKEIPSDYVEKANKKDAVLEKIGWQDKAGKPAILQGLAKTVGASAAMATGAAYSTAVPTTLAKLGGNILAGGVATAGYSMLDGRTPTKEEYAYGAGAEMLMPLGIKGISSAYGKIFNNKTITPLIKNTIQEVSPVTKNESVYQPIPFHIEKPTTNTLQLKSTMLGSPLEKQLSKDGMLSINSLQAHLNNPSTSMADRTMIQKVLNEKFAGQSKINYNDLRKAVSDEMVPLEKNFDSNYSDYGISNIGYHTSKTKPIIDLDDEIRGYTEMANNQTYNETTRNSYRLHLDELKKRKANELLTPQENTSIVYSNKDKFGRGSTDHFENEGTLGHSRILVSNEEKDVMHVLEQQSDFYQKHSPEEIGMSEELMKNINRLDKDLSAKKDILHKMKTEGIDFYGNPIKPNDIPEMESLIKQQSEINKLANADLSNITQKSLLGKTHQERLLQENVAHAAQNGQTKMRYPTPETAAKIQGYTPKKVLDENKFDIEVKNKLAEYQKKMSDIGDEDFKYTNESRTKSVRLGRILDTQYPMKAGETPEETIINLQNKYGDDAVSIYKEYRTLQQKDHAFDIDIDKRKFYLRREIADYKNELSLNPKYQKNIYESAHETILKKYADNPKMIKKILGQDTRTVTDSKGNSWYEFDIPEAFRKGKAEIKALSTIGAIATGYKAIVDKNKK